MAATTVNIGGTSDPLALLVAVSIPRSGSVNDLKMVYDKSVLGAIIAITDLAVGAWDIEFTNNFPVAAKLVITTGVENTQTVGTRIPAVNATITNGSGLSININEILITAANNVSAAGADLNAWVKVERSVF